MAFVKSPLTIDQRSLEKDRRREILGEHLLFPSRLHVPHISHFVPKRQIADNVILVYEALHSIRSKKAKKGFMALKLDLEIAYDKLDWPFIRHTWRDMKLPERMANSIMACINLSSLSVLWNGEKTESFRQCDPLSPYFIHYLHGKIKPAEDQ
ncbi:uncharacterized protein LOC141617012 [Silene latifolia]|uniref:uncharacterized protein LOC141617012 n=1 Tax=Silene latifolia TaxID=37657 RepID=UPI003D76C3CF